MYGNLSEESQQVAAQLMSSSYDFSRCVRADGSAYGTRGKCRKGVQSELTDILKKPLVGRVPRNDPKEPLASGNTPLEKAEAKLAVFEKAILDPDRTPSEKELEQYGKLKNAVDTFKTMRQGKQIPLLQRDLFQWEDRSDLDTSEKRKIGKEIRRVVPDPENRKKLARAKRLYSEHFITKNDPLKKTPYNASDAEMKKLEERKQELYDAYKGITIPDIIGKYRGTSKVPSLIAALRKKLKDEYWEYKNALFGMESRKKEHDKIKKGIIEKWKNRALTKEDVLAHGLSDMVKYHKDGTISFHP